MGTYSCQRSKGDPQAQQATKPQQVHKTEPQNHFDGLGGLFIDQPVIYAHLSPSPEH